MSNHVQAYWGMLRHTEAYSGITEAYGVIIGHIRNSAYPLHIQPFKHVRWSRIFRTLAYLEQFIPAFSRILRHIQGYWCIFSHTHRRATGGDRGGQVSLFETEKSALILERKVLLVSIYGLNLLLKM